jgi:hypothetical protein
MIPKKVKIGGIDYEVKRNVDRLEGGSDTCGEVSYYDSTIELSSGIYKTQREEQTFLHELLHAMFWNLGYKETDEKLIDGLANIWYALIKDNKGIFT